MVWRPQRQLPWKGSSLLKKFRFPSILRPRAVVYRLQCLLKHSASSRPLLILCTHHKSGTKLIRKVHEDLSDQFGFRFQDCPQDQLGADTDVWLEHHSRVRFDELYRKYRGIHVIRDPRDMIVSGYFYHFRCEEEWCLEPRPELDGRSFQQLLRSLPEEEGISAEMERAQYDLDGMARWDYENPWFLEVKLEEILDDYDGQFKRIFRHFGFEDTIVGDALDLARRHDINTFSDERIEADPHIHSRGTEKWRLYFKEHHRVRFDELFPGLLAKLGYEEGPDWPGPSQG